MASALIQSNAQSALISTLDSAPTAQTNPFEYSLSKRVPSHGVQITQLQPVNAGATAPGSVLNFDLIKMGFTRSLTLKLDVYHAALGDGKSLATPRTGFLNLIDHIDIESSSRRILTMSRAALIAAYSDLNHEQRMAFERGCRMTSNGKLQFPANLAANESDPIQIYIPLLFSVFDNPGLALATGFTEPIRISIKFASSYNFVKDITVASGNGAELTAAITVNKPRLIVEHRLLPNELEDRTISALFQNGPLSQLVYDYEEETEELKTMSAAGAAGVTMSHEIRSTAVATDIYVFAECKMDQFPMGAAGTDDDDLMSALVPLPLETISFTASGQTIIDNVPAEYVGCFGKRTLRDGFFGGSGGGGFEISASAAGDQLKSEVGNACFVYRLQFGMDSSKQYDSNGISLRELNAPTITVQLGRIGTAGGTYQRQGNVRTASKSVTLHTVIRKLGLQTIDSSSGRLVSTLSN